MKPHDPTAVDDARWHAQERARRGDPEADPLDLRVARALRQAPPVGLPPLQTRSELSNWYWTLCAASPTSSSPRLAFGNCSHSRTAGVTSQRTQPAV